jgi:hypothetical protein
MWTALAVTALAGLSPMQANQLTLTHVRSVYGYYLPERESNKIIPGDALILFFDIVGLKVDKTGRMLYTMSMEITNSQGKLESGPQPEDRETFSSLGGNRVPATAIITTEANQPPGEYTVGVTVTDRGTRSTQRISRKFEVLPKTFGIVRLSTTVDPGARFAVPPSGLVGEQRCVNFFAIGFQRDPTTKQPSVSAELRILDEKGKAIEAKPIMGAVDQDVPERSVVIPMQFTIALNRPGRFAIELQAVDRVNKKTAKVSFPLVVTEQK